MPVQRRHRQRRRDTRRLRLRVGIGDPRVADGGADRIREAAVHLDNRRQRDDAFRRRDRAGKLGQWRRRRSGRDQEPAAACLRLANHLEAGRRVLRELDDDVLEQIAEAGFDGALVAGVDLEIVGDGALLIDLAVGLREDGSGRIA